MKKIFYSGNDKIWKGFEAPEKPRTKITDGRASYVSDEAYQKAYAAARVPALPIINQEICPQNISQVEEGKDYDWPGAWEKTDSVNGKLPVSLILSMPRIDPVGQEKITFCDKCGEAYETSKGHECYVLSLPAKETPSSGHQLSEGGEVEDVCSTCGKVWGDPDGSYCSNSFHLASPKVTKQLVEYFNENKALHDALKDILPLAIFWDCQNKEQGDREAIDRAKSLLSGQSKTN